MIELAWFLSLVIAYCLGHQARNVRDAIRNLQVTVKEKADARKPKETSEVLDPYDDVARITAEVEARRQELNK